MKAVLFLIFIPILAFAENNYSQMISEYQKVVQIRSSTDHTKLAHDIGINAIIIAKGKKFAVIRPIKSIGIKRFNTLIDHLKKKKYIESIKQDRVMTPRSNYVSDENCILCPSIKSSTSDSLSTFNISLDLLGKKCQLYPHCKDSNPAWAKMQIGADLANNIIEQLNPSSDMLSNVAVIDSGFDMTTRDQFNVNNLNVAKGFDSAGPPDRDVDGHGTSVSGMIAAKGTGITSHINLDVYRVTEENANGSTSSGLIAASIEKACQSADVVNVSWGSLLDEISNQDLNKEKWYEEAVAKGCIIVKAAGNSGLKHNEERPIPVEAPFVQVSASQSFGGEASFSTSGQITAPGEGVYSLLSSHHEYSATTIDNSCEEEGAKTGPINGTSFSSPAIAGVMGQIITILRSRGKLPADPVKKVTLVKSILMASTKVGKYFQNNKMVNAVGAALIARGIDDYTVDQDKLVEIAREQSRENCLKETPNCITQNGCENKKDCVSKLRYKLLVCDPITADDAGNLHKSLQQMEESELLNSLNFNIQDNLIDKDKVKKDLINSWDDNLIRDGVDDLDVGLNLFDVAYNKNIPGFINYQHFKQILKSITFKFNFPVNKYQADKTSIGGYDDEIKERTINYFKAMNPSEQLKLLQEIPLEKTSIVVQTSLLYLLKQDQDSLSPQVAEQLDRTIKLISAQWINGELDLGELDVTKNAPVYDMFVEENPEIISKIKNTINDPLLESNMHLAGYLLVSKKILTDDQRSDFATRIINEKADTPGSSYRYIVDRSVELLISKNSDESRITLEKSFLSNPKLSLPDNEYSIYSFIYKGTNPLEASSKEFWDSYIKNCINDVKNDLASSSNLHSFIIAPKAYENILKSIFYNNSDNSNELLENKANDIREIIATSAKIYTTLDHHKSSYQYDGKESLAMNVVEKSLKLMREFEKQGKIELLKEALITLKNKLDSTYFSQSIRQQIRRLYDLGEE